MKSKRCVYRVWLGRDKIKMMANKLSRSTVKVLARNKPKMEFNSPWGILIINYRNHLPGSVWTGQLEARLPDPWPDIPLLVSERHANEQIVIKLSNCAWAGLQIFKIRILCDKDKYWKNSSDFTVCFGWIDWMERQEFHVSTFNFSVTGTKEPHHSGLRCHVWSSIKAKYAENSSAIFQVLWACKYS